MDNKIRIIVFLAVCLAIVLTIGKVLNPLDPRMFNFHDDTQAARIQEMAISIKAGKIPPRLAPEFSHNLGFPVFNFYAPFSYLITTGMHLLGIPIPMALKLSFFLTVVVSFLTMFLLLRAFFGFYPSILGGVAYASSLWFAIEIFVRGNLAECWFLALFPLSLYFFVMNSRKLSHLLIIISVLVVSMTLTVHNVLSLLAVGVFFVFILLLKNKKRGLLVLFLGLLLSSYFLIPAITELNLTHAAQTAQMSQYKDHFLCAWQIWHSPKWEYSGSAIGCENDGMPFTLGKIHIVSGVLGIMFFLFVSLLKRKKNQPHLSISFFTLVLGLLSLFLTTYQSAFVWNIFKPVLALFQFPWRFLIFVVFMLAYFSAYFFNELQKRFGKLGSYLAIMAAIFFLLTSGKFFSKPWLMSYDEFASAYIAPNYITRTVAYNVAEYLPKTADYEYWRSFDPQIHPGKDLVIGVTDKSPIEAKDTNIYSIAENNPFSKKVIVNSPATITVNVHYFPFWHIYINDKQFLPRTFDKLGRPIIYLTQPSRIRILYDETVIEKISNTISIAVILFLVLLVIYKPLWIRLKPLLK